MPEDPSKAAGLEHQRINPNQDEELKSWAARFGVSPERLRETVLLVGDHADEVERYLRDGSR
jgi:hypothetical protein